jgi:ribosomal protein S18 acetylase RimI-like enzyme
MRGGVEGIVVRQLGVPDAARYRSLRMESLRAFPHVHRTSYEDALAQPQDWIEKRLSAPGEYWFGAFDGEELAGAVGLRTQDGSKVCHVASLIALTVARGHQRRGIGSALVGHLVGFARSLGYLRQLQLTVIDGNASAQRLYDAFGFVQFGLEPDALLHEGKYYAKQHRQLYLDSLHTHE